MGKKNKTVEKETRQLMEAMSDLIKKKGDRYKFKTKKKKTIKKMKEQCVHWTMDKGKPRPAVRRTSDDCHWRCRICGATFPIKPLDMDDYTIACDRILEIINQLQFLSVKMGGDADDTKLFLKLKACIPRLRKVQKNIIKRVNKRQEWEDRKKNTDSMEQFTGFSGGYDYR